MASSRLLLRGAFLGDPADFLVDGLDGVVGTVGARAGIADEHRRMLHPEQRFEHGIGEAALLADLAIEARGQSAAAEDVVDDISRHEVRVAALHARAAEGDDGLRHVEGHEGALRRLCGLDVGDRREVGLGGQAAEGVVEQLAEGCRIDVADDCDLEPILGKHAADIVLHVGDRDGRYAVEVAVGLPAIGMIAEGDFEELAARQRGRVRGFAAQARDDLGADALNIGGVEMRRGQRAPQEVEGLVLVVAQHAQAAAEGVAGGAEGELDGAAVEPFVEGLGIEIAGAFVEEVADQVGDARLVLGVLGRAAGKGIFHRDQRHGCVLHEPGLDAAGRDQALDLCGGL